MKRRSELYREMFEDPQPNLETHQIGVIRSVSDQRKYFKFYTLLLLRKDYKYTSGICSNQTPDSSLDGEDESRTK